MCGIAGFVASPTRQNSREGIETIARAMDDSLAHRGPDGHDIWIDPDADVALIHRRLAIVDLTPTGAQPMLSANGRFVITYNGEVYNFRELRSELQALGYWFRSQTDSEVVLYALAEWGLKALSSIPGTDKNPLPGLRCAW